MLGTVHKLNNIHSLPKRIHQQNRRKGGIRERKCYYAHSIQRRLKHRLSELLNLPGG